jgi:hypothetical protein
MGDQFMRPVQTERILMFGERRSVVASNWWHGHGHGAFTGDTAVALLPYGGAGRPAHVGATPSS